MAVSKNSTKQISHRACLGDLMGQTYSFLCLSWHLSRASFHRFTVYFAAARSKGSQSNT